MTVPRFHGPAPCLRALRSSLVGTLLMDKTPGKWEEAVEYQDACGWSAH